MTSERVRALDLGQRVPVKGPDGRQIGEAVVQSIRQDGSVDCEIQIDPPVPEWLKEDVNHISIASEPSDPLFPVVITKTVERVIWVRACAEDHATDLVVEQVAKHFESHRSSPYRDPVYDVRATKTWLVPPTLPDD